MTGPQFVRNMNEWMRAIEKRLTAVERRRRRGGGGGDDGGGWIIGEIKLWPAPADKAPTGWVLCNGAALSRATYPGLFATIATAYGAGNGTTTFNVPNLQGRVPAGYSTGANFNALGKTGGAETHTLTTAQMPSHTHTGIANSDGAHTHGPPPEWTNYWMRLTGGSSPYYVSSGATHNQFVDAGPATTTGSGGAHTHALTIDAAGGGGAHNNLQPYLVINYIIYTGAV